VQEYVHCTSICHELLVQVHVPLIIIVMSLLLRCTCLSPLFVKSSLFRCTCLSPSLARATGSCALASHHHWQELPVQVFVPLTIIVMSSSGARDSHHHSHELPVQLHVSLTIIGKSFLFRCSCLSPSLS
jgi:hypothetical protein